MPHSIMRLLTTLPIDERIKVINELQHWVTELIEIAFDTARGENDLED